jgi:acetyltransferase-like isoleucine patch superfamily enzyme
MLTIALWPARGDFATRELFGLPLWRRTLSAARGLGAVRTTWLGSSPPEGIEAAGVSALYRSRDTVAVLSAELPCLTPRSLRNLVKRGRLSPHALTRGGRKRPLAVAAPASAWKSALDGASSLDRFEAVVRALRPAPFFPRDESEVLLVDSPETWARALHVLREKKVAALLRRGVVIPDPASVLVDPDVSVGGGAKLLPWVHLEGRTVIGPRVTVSSFTHVVDSVLGAGTLVLDHCFIRSSRIGKNVQIGPFAHLRPDSDVGASAKIGNFVELKNTRVLRGAKAPHLSYLGDAVIGRGSNVGAGTITCNYDGKRKHRTIVGDGAFIGSDVQLVAPVRVGKGAYVAAGSCIVEDVPAHALAIARSRQTVKRGWAKSRS